MLNIKKITYQSHFIYPEIICAQSLSCVQLSVNPWTVAPPGSSVHGISQARILDWVAIIVISIYEKNKLYKSIYGALYIYIIHIRKLYTLPKIIVWSRERQK